MAKKKAKPQPAQRAVRKQTYTAARINQHVERLREQATRLANLSRQMEEYRLEIVVDGHAMLLRGLNQVDNFADNATRAVREARLAQEDL
jgi:hypothetical protein